MKTLYAIFDFDKFFKNITIIIDNKMRIGKLNSGIDLSGDMI